MTSLDVIPMAASYTMEFKPWKFEDGSKCTFNTYKLSITDPKDITLDVVYTLNVSQQWLRGDPVYMASDPAVDVDSNKLDFIFDVFQYNFNDLGETNSVTFDKSVIDAKEVAHSYYGDYKVVVKGGWDVACCSTAANQVLEFTYTLDNICDEPTMIDLIYPDLLLKATAFNQTILDQI